METTNATGLWEIQHSTFFQGWLNTFTDILPDDSTIPTTFKTFEEANTYLDDFLDERRDEEEPDQYRIRPFKGSLTPIHSVV